MTSKRTKMRINDDINRLTRKVVEPAPKTLNARQELEKSMQSSDRSRFKRSPSTRVSEIS